MPDDKEKKDGKMVDIDTSGPGAEVDLPEEKVKSVEQEETNAKTCLLYTSPSPRD